MENLIFKVNESLLTPDKKKKYIDKLKKEYPDGIKPCGTDALRFGLLSYTIQGKNINLNPKKIEAYRNFCNKIWNSFKFSQTYL